MAKIIGGSYVYMYLTNLKCLKRVLTNTNNWDLVPSTYTMFEGYELIVYLAVVSVSLATFQTHSSQAYSTELPSNPP